MTTPNRRIPFNPEITALALIAIAYWLAVRMGLLLVSQTAGIASIWVAGGVALGALLINPRTRWVKLLCVIFAVNALGNWIGGNSLWVSLGFALANTLEPFLCAWSLEYFYRQRISFEHPVEIVILFSAAVFVNGVTALLGAAVSALAFNSSFFEAWLLWWAADGLGIVLIAPVIVAWSKSRNRTLASYTRRLPEMLLLFFAVALFAWLLFGPFTQAERPILRNYMLFPLLIWIAFRFELRDMANALLLFAAIAVWNTLREYGIFSFPNQSHTDHLVALQIFLSVASFSGLLLSAMVAERRRTESVLQESRRQLDEAQSLTHVGHWNWDVTTQTLEWSDEIYRIFGVQPRSFKPSVEAFEATIHPDDLNDFLSRRAQMLEEKQEAVIEHRIILPDGAVRYVEERTQLELNRQGAVRRVSGTVQDITERKMMEVALRASEEKYRLVADFTYDWEAWHAPYGVYLYVSPACKRITGYTADEFIADANLIVSITHPDDRASVLDHFQAITHQSKERDVTFDFRIITKSGETRWINHTCTAVYGEDGKWLGRRESNRDVTARKQSDAALRSRLRLSQFADNHTVDDVLQYTLDETEALTESQIGFFHSLDADQNTLTLQMWSTNTIQNMCSAAGKGQHYPVEQAGVWVDCVRKREPVIYNEYLGLPASQRKGMPEGHAPVIRLLAVPVLRNDLIVAIMGVGNKQADYDYQDIKTVSQMADLAWDVILRKRSEDEVRQTKNALEIANRELQIALEREKELSHTDALTGVHNRRFLFELAEREFNIATRHHLPLTVMLFDLDHFKKVNDTFGHDVGDLVLQRVVETARAELRSSDIIGRYGGEEFVIILPMTTVQQAYPVAERIRAGVAALRVPTHKKDAVATLSIGIAELAHMSQESASVDSLIRCADEAMYASKQAGRNRISIFEWK